MGKLATTFDVSKCKSIMDVLSESGTAWEPSAHPINGIMEHKSSTGITSVDGHGHYAILRPDTMQVLGTASGRYRPNSHVAHLGRLDRLVRNGDLLPVNVSVWDSGKLMAFQFRSTVLDHDITKGDTVSPLLTLAFYNDGKHGDMSFFADFRWSCTNQLGRVAKAMVGNERAYHRGDVAGKYETILMEQITDLKESAEWRYKAMQDMVRKKLPGKDLLLYWAEVLSIKSPDEVISNMYAKPGEIVGDGRTLQNVLGCYRQDDCGAPGSMWHAFNAITRYVTHVQGRSRAVRSARALLGSGQTIIAKAFKLAEAE